MPLRFSLALVLVFAAACAGRGASSSSAPPSGERQEALVRDARAFMDGYARDLAAGNRDGVIARYDDRGAYLVGGGEKTLLPVDSIRAMYRSRWRPPASFAWVELSYEVAGPDAVVVTGGFRWGINAERKDLFSYTGLLVRRAGGLRIRLEDEDPAPRPAESGSR